MSKYPKWWDTTITVYNRYEKTETGITTWHRSVIENCFFKAANNKIVIDNAVINTDETIIRVREDDKFKEPYEWIQLSENERCDFFTFKQGDIIIKGAVEDEINEYESGKTANELLSKYKEAGICLRIKAWQDNSGASRGLPHYFVRGE